MSGAKFNSDINSKSVNMGHIIVFAIKAKVGHLAEHSDFNGELCFNSVVIDGGARKKARFSKGQVKNGQVDKQ